MRLGDTHTYDGQLGSRKAELQKHIFRATSLSREQKLELFGKLLGHLRTVKGYSPQSEHFLRIIIQDFATGNRAANYDPTNDLDAADLLVLCAELCFCAAPLRKLGKSDVYPALEASEMLNEQLGEIANGPCVQGKTTRLFQVIVSFEEFL